MAGNMKLKTKLEGLLNGPRPITLNRPSRLVPSSSTQPSSPRSPPVRVLLANSRDEDAEIDTSLRFRAHTTGGIPSSPPVASDFLGVALEPSEMLVSPEQRLKVKIGRDRANTGKKRRPPTRGSMAINRTVGRSTTVGKSGLSKSSSGSNISEQDGVKLFNQEDGINGMLTAARNAVARKKMLLEKAKESHSSASEPQQKAVASRKLSLLPLDAETATENAQVSHKGVPKLSLGDIAEDRTELSSIRRQLRSPTKRRPEQSTRGSVSSTTSQTTESTPHPAACVDSVISSPGRSKVLGLVSRHESAGISQNLNRAAESTKAKLKSKKSADNTKSIRVLASPVKLQLEEAEIDKCKPSGKSPGLETTVNKYNSNDNHNDLIDVTATSQTTGLPLIRIQSEVNGDLETDRNDTGKTGAFSSVKQLQQELSLVAFDIQPHPSNWSPEILRRAGDKLLPSEDNERTMQEKCLSDYKQDPVTDASKNHEDTVIDDDAPIVTDHISLSSAATSDFDDGCIKTVLNEDVTIGQHQTELAGVPCYIFRIHNESNIFTYSVEVSIEGSRNMGWLGDDSKVSSLLVPGATVDLEEVMVVSPELGEWSLSTEFKWERRGRGALPKFNGNEPSGSHRSILKMTTDGQVSIRDEIAHREELTQIANSSMEAVLAEDISNFEQGLQRKPTAPRSKITAKSVKQAVKLVRDGSDAALGVDEDGLPRPTTPSYSPHPFTPSPGQTIGGSTVWPIDQVTRTEEDLEYHELIESETGARKSGVQSLRKLFNRRSPSPTKRSSSPSTKCSPSKKSQSPTKKKPTSPVKAPSPSSSPSPSRKSPIILRKTMKILKMERKNDVNDDVAKDEYGSGDLDKFVIDGDFNGERKAIEKSQMPASMMF